MKKRTKRTLGKTARMLISAIAFLPVIGEIASNGRDFYDDLKELAKDQAEFRRILNGIRSIKVPKGLTEEDAAQLKAEIIKLLENEDAKIENDTLTDAGIMKLKTDLQEAVFEDRAVDERITEYISAVVEFIVLPSVRIYLMDPRCLSIALQDKVLELDARIEELEKKSIDSNTHSTLNTHNDDYIRHFQEPLFLEERGSSVSLATIYVSPRVENSGKLAADVIMQWYLNDQFTSCMILYGEAGIGKTSLVSKILADASGITNPKKLEYDFEPDEVKAVALRDKIGIFEKTEGQFSSVAMLSALFGVDAENKKCLQDKLLILDGFDELMVLAPEYQEKAERFVSGLVQENHGLKILITTRPGYSTFLDSLENDRKHHLIKRTICWEEDEVNNWCEQYEQEVGVLYEDLIADLPESEQVEMKKRIAEKQEWCRNFPNQFRNLPPCTDADKRREVFCIPIILYIVCNSGINLEQEQTIGQIYDRAFRSVIMREHGDTLSRNGQVKDADRKMQRVHWQYTKELAYQMLYIGKLELIDDENSDDPRAVRFRNAQNRTLKLLKNEYPELQRNDLKTSKYLAVFQFAKHGTRGGIAFVHKTVYEYFAALKLYEDYFSQFNAEYFGRVSEDEAATEVAKSYLEAFRYKAIPPEVISYLTKMRLPAFLDDESDIVDENLLFNKDLLFSAFQNGIRKDLIARIPIDKAVEEYINTNVDFESINVQFCRAFQNFTRYLTYLGYRNCQVNQREESRKPFYPVARILRSLISTEINVFCPGWNLEGAHLEGAHLEGAHLEGANLKRAYLDMANLHLAHLDNSNMEGASLARAFIFHTYLEDAHLEGAHFELAIFDEARLDNSNLQGAHLEGTVFIWTHLTGADLRDADFTAAYLARTFQDDVNWRGAKFCLRPGRITFFPNGFNPIEHGMIEVDEYGNPIERN